MKSDYQGLWKSEKIGWYNSKVFNKKELPDKFTIVMRYNKYHEPKKKTPNFIFNFRESELDHATIKFEKDWYETVQESIRRIKIEAQNGRHDINYAGLDAGLRSLGDIIDMCSVVLRDYFDE